MLWSIVVGGLLMKVRLATKFLVNFSICQFCFVFKRIKHIFSLIMCLLKLFGLLVYGELNGIIVMI